MGTFPQKQTQPQRRVAIGPAPAPTVAPGSQPHAFARYLQGAAGNFAVQRLAQAQAEDRAARQAPTAGLRGSESEQEADHADAPTRHAPAPQQAVAASQPRPTILN